MRPTRCCPNHRKHKETVNCVSVCCHHLCSSARNQLVVLSLSTYSPFRVNVPFTPTIGASANSINMLNGSEWLNVQSTLIAIVLRIKGAVQGIVM